MIKPNHRFLLVYFIIFSVLISGTGKDSALIAKQNYPIQIEDRVHDVGIGELNGYLVLVPGANVGEKVNVNIESVKNGYAISHKINSGNGDIGPEPNPSPPVKPANVTPAKKNETTPKPPTPGFESTLAITGVLAIAYLVIRRKNR